MGQKPHDAGLGNDFWDLTPKPQLAKEKNREIKCLGYFTKHSVLRVRPHCRTSLLCKADALFRVQTSCCPSIHPLMDTGCFCDSAEHRCPCLHLLFP